jgi:hypothetical protein
MATVDLSELLPGYVFASKEYSAPKKELRQQLGNDDISIDKVYINEKRVSRNDGIPIDVIYVGKGGVDGDTCGTSLDDPCETVNYAWGNRMTLFCRMCIMEGDYSVSYHDYNKITTDLSLIFEGYGFDTKDEARYPILRPGDPDNSDGHWCYLRHKDNVDYKNKKNITFYKLKFLWIQNFKIWFFGITSSYYQFEFEDCFFTEEGECKKWDEYVWFRLSTGLIEIMFLFV